LGWWREMSRLLPSGFYISAGSEEDEKGNLFRPKQLTHFIIPNLGMVMNPPFWVKYVLFLRKHGFELSRMEGESDIDFRVRCARLFFEVPLSAFSGKEKYDYSILSILMRAMFESRSTFENIVTGRDWCSKRPGEWFFYG